jgi:hypothetical protein
VLDNADGPSSLVASLSMVVELLEVQVNATTTNVIRWGTQSAMVAILLHFPKLEHLGSACNADLMEDQVDALWTRVRAALYSLTVHILPSIARSPPDGSGE